MKRLLPIVLLHSLLYVSLAIAWPTGQYEAVQLLSDPSMVYQTLGVTEADDGTIRLLVKQSPWGTLEYTTGLLALDREGNLIWPGSLDSHLVHERTNWWLEANYIMKCGPNGETWVVYEDYYDTPDQGDGYRDTPYISARRIDAQGNANSTLIEVDGLNTQQARIPAHLEVLDDGGAIVLWATMHHNVFQFYEVRAQRFTANCEPLWGNRGQLIYESTGDENVGTWIGLSDDNDGFYFNLNNCLAWLNSSGTLVWGYNDVVVDSVSAIHSLAWNDDKSEIGLLCRKKVGWQTFYWLSAVNTNGDFIHGPGTFIDHDYQDYTIFYGTNNGYNVIDRIEHELFRFDSNLNQMGTVFEFAWLEDVGEQAYSRNNYHGMRMSTIDGPLPNPNNSWVYSYDEDMNLLWTIRVNEDDEYYHRIRPYIDTYGTTWMFWNIVDYDGGYADLYMNVCDLDGTWGYTDVDETESISLLPSDLPPLIYPNPFNSSTNLRYSLNRPGIVTVCIHDILGRELFSDQYSRARGWHTEPLSFNGVPSGMYIVNVSAMGVNSSRKVVLIK